MTSSAESSTPPAGKAIVLSIKPKYAELILAGTKTVEFRRAWAAEKIDVIAVYASSPIQKLIGIVQVSEIVRAKPTTLWSYCSKRGGGLTRAEFTAYFSGKDAGFAVLLKGAKRFLGGIDPKKVVKDFTPPQSFRYLTSAEMRKLEKLALQLEAKR